MGSSAPPDHRIAGGREHVAVLLTLLLGVRANTVGKQTSPVLVHLLRVVGL